MDQTIYIKPDHDSKYEISISEFKFHPVLKDIEYIILIFLLSNKALSLYETQNILLADVNFASLIERYNNIANLKIEKDPYSNNYQTKLNIKGQMIFLGKAMSILMYDYVLASKYNSKINNHPTLQFLRFVRNGAAHNNKFNIKDDKGDWKLGETETIIWHTKKIQRELQDKEVFPSFVSIMDIILIAHEISEELNRLDG